jgi:hypothetical protein
VVQRGGRLDLLNPVGTLYPNLIARISGGKGCCQEASRGDLDEKDVRICFSACVMYTLPILYDIYCLMLLKGCFRLLDRCKSLPNLRDYCLNPATPSRLGACLFVLTVSVFTQRPLGQNSKTNSIWPISLPIQCFARSHARGYRNRSAAV